MSAGRARRYPPGGGRLPIVCGVATDSSRRWVALGLFLLLAGIYGLTAGGHTYSSDEEGMYQTTRSLLERRSPVLAITEDNVHVTPSTAGRDGRPVGVSGLGISVAGIPLYLVGSVVSHTVARSYADYTERVFIGWTNSFVTAAGVVLLFLLAELLGARRRWAVALALTYGLATMVWPHAKTFFSEPLTTTLALAGAYFAVRAVADSSLRLAAASGVFAGLAVSARSTAGLFLPVIGLYLLFAFPRRWANWFGRWLRVGLAYTAGAAGPLALFFWSNWWRYGAPTNMGPKSIPLNYPLQDGLYGFFLSPGKSLFLYAPVVLVGLLAVPFAPRRHRPAVALMVALGAVNVALFARFFQWHGDHAWGPRYLIMTIPFFVLPLAPLLDRVRWQRALAASAVLGLFSAGLGVVMYFNQYFYIVEHTYGSHDTPAGPSYWLPMHYTWYWSPIPGTIRALPDVVRHSARRLDGYEKGMYEFPDGTQARYGWYFLPPQLDSWAYWVFPAHGPKKLLLMGPVFAGMAVGGGVLLRRSLRAGRADEPSTAAADGPPLTVTATAAV